MGVARVVTSLVLTVALGACSERVVDGTASKPAQEKAPYGADRSLPPLPVIGYVATPTAGGTDIDVYYLAPADSVPRAVGLMTDDSCVSLPDIVSDDDGRIEISVRLMRPSSAGDPNSPACQMTGQYTVRRQEWGPFARVGQVVTTSPIATTGNEMTRPAAPGNVVPRLDGLPATDTFTGSDRGLLPIRDYRLSEDGYLDITYLSPRVPGAAAGSHTPGCRDTRMHSGIESNRITVNVRLGWTDGGGRYTEADSALCRNEGPWATVRTMMWIKVGADPLVLTDGPIVDAAGAVLVPAAAGNRVPERA